jgi:hypothetical protein
VDKIDRITRLDRATPMRRLLPALAVLLAVAAAPAADPGWVTLVGGTAADLAHFRGKTDGWQAASAVALDAKNPRRLSLTPGEGLLVNGTSGRAPDLVSKPTFGDVEVHAEFLIPQRSNSGIKLMGLYEIQILDSSAVPPEKLTGDHTGGIYPRAEQAPSYRHLDKGFAPLVNAAKPAGEWQSLDVTFTAPRFAPDGKKRANAVFVKVLLNGKVVQDNRDVGSPTGHAHVKPETATGPLLLQGDHGPVAFRAVRVRPLAKEQVGDRR